MMAQTSCRIYGEVAEWAIASALKAEGRREATRGFESHPLLHYGVR